ELMQLPPNAVVPGYVTELFPAEVMDFYASSGHSYGELQPPEVAPPNLGEDTKIDSDPGLQTQDNDTDGGGVAELAINQDGGVDLELGGDQRSLRIGTERGNFSSVEAGISLPFFGVNFGL